MAKNPQVRAIEQEADRLSRLDGKTSHKERYRIRAELRAQAGLGKEKKTRGGAAGFYDKHKDSIIPIAAGALGLMTGGVAAPMLAAAAARGLDVEGKGGIFNFDVGNAARGAMEGAAAGSVGKFAGGLTGVGGAAGATAATPAASASQAMRVADPINGGMVTIGGGAAPIAPAPASSFSLPQIASNAGNWLTANGGRNALSAATAVSGVLQQQRGNQMMADAAKAEERRWAENAPLRNAGRDRLMAGVPGNPFAQGGR